MASLTSRLTGWAAGRIGGEKARKGTMDWMGKTGLGKALSFAGDSAILGGVGKLAGMAGRAAGLGSKVGAAATGSGSATAQRQNLLPNDIIDVNPVSRARDLAVQRAAEGIGGMSGADITSRIGSFGDAAAQRALTPSFGGQGISQMVRDNASRSMATPSMLDRLQGLGSSIGRGIGGAARGAIDFAKANPQAVGKGLEAFAALQQNQAAQGLARERIGLERQQMEAQMARQKQMAEALAPLLAQLRARMGGMS